MANLGPDVAHIFNPSGCEAEAEAGRSLCDEFQGTRAMQLYPWGGENRENGVEMQRRTDRQERGCNLPILRLAHGT